MNFLTGKEASLLSLLVMQAPLSKEDEEIILKALTGPALKIAKNLIKTNKRKIVKKSKTKLLPKKTSFDSVNEYVNHILDNYKKMCEGKLSYPAIKSVPQNSLPWREQVFFNMKKNGLL